MTLLKLDTVVTKVYDLLRLDSRTSGVDWFNGRRSPLRRQKTPAGDVYLGPGSVRPYTMPSGEDAPVQILIDLIYGSQEGAPKAEQTLRDGIEAVVEVLVDSWDIGLSYVLPEGLGWAPVINPEAPEDQATARISLALRIIPAGV